MKIKWATLRFAFYLLKRKVSVYSRYRFVFFFFCMKKPQSGFKFRNLVRNQFRFAETNIFQ